MATTNKVKGWTGVLMTEDSSSHWPIKRRYVYSETSRRAGLEFVRIFGHDGVQRDTGDARQLNRSSPSGLKQAGSANRFLPRAAILSSGPRGAVNSSLNYYNW